MKPLNSIIEFFMHERIFQSRAENNQTWKSDIRRLKWL